MRAAALIAIAATARAQPAGAASGQSPMLQSETRLVLVDAAVTDKKGHTIRGLQASDFHLWEDDKEQKIAGCNFEGDNPQTERGQTRYTLFLFDDVRMQPADLTRSRSAAQQFVDANVGPTRPMAVAAFDGTMRVIQNFTFDAQKLGQALNQGRASAPTATAWDRKGTLDTSLVTVNRSAVRDVLTELGVLARQLGALPGRKTLVLFTPGFPLEQENRAALTSALALCSRANVSIYTVDLSGSTLSASGAIPTADIGSSVRITAPVPGSPESEPRPRGTGESPAGPQPAALHQVQEIMAKATGGFVAAGGKDLFAGVDRIGKDQDQFYVLSYPEPNTQDGSCHSLKVKVDRGGAAVRARSAYCNVRGPDLLAGTPAAQRLEQRLADPAPGRAGGFLTAPYFYTAENTARVNVAMDIPAAEIRFDQQADKVAAVVRVMGVAYRQDGAAAARFSDAVKLEFDSQQASLQQSLVHYEHQFEMAAGQYTLKLAYSSSDEQSNEVETRLVIEPYDGKRFILSAVALSNDVRRAPQRGAVAALAEDRTPLIAEGLLITPSATNRFRPTDTAVLYAEAYDPAPVGASSPEIAVVLKIKDRNTGVEKDNSGLIKVAPTGAAEGATAKVGLLLPLKKLGPGTYRLELTAYDSVGNKTAVRTVAFDVE